MATAYTLDKLERAIETFKQSFSGDQGWDTPKRAFTECGTASNAFVRFLSVLGVNSRAEDLVLDKAHDQHLSPFYPDREGYGHWVVNVDERWLIDWTARQFAPEAPYPIVITLKKKSLRCQRCGKIQKGKRLRCQKCRLLVCYQCRNAWKVHPDDPVSKMQVRCMSCGG
jgi:hypothetical protein